MDQDYSEYFPNFYEIDALIREELLVISMASLEEPTYLILEIPDLKERMLKLSSDLIEKHRVAPVLRKYRGQLLLRLAILDPKEKRSNRNNWILLFATLATVGGAGYLQAGVLDEVNLQSTILLNAMLFTVALMSIITIHELGHMYACKRNKIDSTPPFFLPFPPIGFPIGTMGAFIKARSPIKNRDELFTLGFAGPISGFIVAVIVTLIGLSMSFSVSETQVNEWQNKGLVEDLPWNIIMFEILSYIAQKVGLIAINQGETLLVHPVAFAGWVGFLLTGLNLLPLGQLDGGHVFRSTTNEITHRQATMFSALILIIIGLWAMALLALFLFRGGHPGGLDDVSPLPRRKKILAYFSTGLAVLCLPIPVYFFV